MWHATVDGGRGWEARSRTAVTLGAKDRKRFGPGPHAHGLGRHLGPNPAAAQLFWFNKNYALLKTI